MEREKLTEESMMVKEGENADGDRGIPANLELPRTSFEGCYGEDARALICVSRDAPTATLQLSSSRRWR